MNKLETLQQQVVQWAEAKGLLTDVTPERIEKQTLKVLEEIGETAGAYLKGNLEDVIDGAGDCAVTLIILKEMIFKGTKYNRRFESPISLGGINANNELIKCTSNMLNYLTCYHSEDKLFSLERAYFRIIRFAISQDLTLEHCLESAYNVIAKRKGKMVNGTFIKDE